MLRIVALVLVTSSTVYAAASSSQSQPRTIFKRPCAQTRTLLDAAKIGCVACVDALLSDVYAEYACAEDSSVDAIDPDNGWTPLHYAAALGYIVIVNRLINAKAPLLAVDTKGNTPLHLAAMSGQYKVVDALARRDITRNAQNNDGNTPLHLAALWGYNRAIYRLLKYRASITIKNADGDTAYDLAVAQSEQADQGLLKRNILCFQTCVTHLYSPTIDLFDLTSKDTAPTVEKTKNHRSRKHRYRTRRSKKMAESIEQK